LKTLEASALLEVPVEIAYDVVADVGSYPDFVPGCDGVEILEQGAAGATVAVTVSGKGIRERFVTANTHLPNQSITVSLRQGPFEHLEGRWQFAALGEAGCKVTLVVTYQPKGMLAHILGGLADRMASRLVDAFAARMVAVNTGVGPMLAEPTEQV